MATAPDPPARPAVSVVVPVRDDEARLERCLAALDAQTFAEPFEVVVVDNGSARPPEAVVARHPRARLLHEARPSSYAARNRGVAGAEGTILAFTDSDCLPHPDWLERGVAQLRAAERSFVVGRVAVFPRVPGAPTPVERYEMFHAFPQRRYLEKLRFGVTANLLVRREDFDRVGGFNGSLQSSGDADFGQRAHAAGLTGRYADDTVVDHPARHSFAEFRRKNRRLQLGHEKLRRQRGEAFDRAWMARALLVPPVKTILGNARTLTGEGPVALAGYVATAFGLYYLSVLERLRVSAGTAFHARRRSARGA